jgi:hypothetical protein
MLCTLHKVHFGDDTAHYGELINRLLHYLCTSKSHLQPGDAEDPVMLEIGRLSE